MNEWKCCVGVSYSAFTLLFACQEDHLCHLLPTVLSNKEELADQDSPGQLTICMYDTLNSPVAAASSPFSEHSVDSVCVSETANSHPPEMHAASNENHISRSQQVCQQHYITHNAALQITGVTRQAICYPDLDNLNVSLK